MRPFVLNGFEVAGKLEVIEQKILPEKLCESVYIFKKIRYTVCGKLPLCLFLNTFSKENKTYDVPGN